MFTINDLMMENVNDTYGLSTISMDEDYTILAMEKLLSFREDFINANKDLRKGILESNMNREVLNESFSDFYDKIKSIISKIIDFIKSLFKRFITALHRIVLSDKYLLKHTKDFSNFDNEKDTFVFKGFNYSFDPNIPVVNALRTFTTDFVGIDPDKLSNNSKENYSYLNTQYGKLATSISDEDIYNRLRQETIKASDTIYKEDYAEELFRVFRSGEDEKESIDIESPIIISALNFIKGYEKEVSNIKKNKTNIEKQYKQLEDFVKKMISKKDNDVSGIVGLSINIDNDQRDFRVDNNTMSKIDLFINSKCTEIMEMSNIHTLAFSAKLQAEKEAFISSKQILYKALSKIQKRNGDVI